jgi:hypothetical protein
LGENDFIFFFKNLCSNYKKRDVLSVMKKIFYFGCIALLAASCGPRVIDYPTQKVMGYIPIYSNDPNLLKIYSEGPLPINRAGKIYVKGNLIFQNDIGYGIHVFDKTIPSVAKRIGFIHLPGNMEISIKGDLLYANSFDDLVILDITDWRTIKEKQRVKHAFMKGNEAHLNASYLMIPPPEKGVYYECIVPSKGMVIGWKKDSINYSGCYYNE